MSKKIIIGKEKYAVITISPTLITDKAQTYELHRNTFGGEGGGLEQTIVIEDENGNKLVAVLVDEEVNFTATPNDIREGKVAVTDEGITVGEKFIPSYHTVQGYRIILAGKPLVVTGLKTYDLYDYTKLQAMICPYNTSIAKSVGAEMVSIDDNVYEVRSTDSLSILSKNHDDKTVDFGLTNELGTPCIIKYITYKEVE